MRTARDFVREETLRGMCLRGNANDVLPAALQSHESDSNLLQSVQNEKKKKAGRTPHNHLILT